MIRKSRGNLLLEPDAGDFGAEFGTKWTLGHDLGQSNVCICPHLSMMGNAYLIEKLLDH